MTSFDPGIYTQIQSTMVTSFNTVLSGVSAYSQDLLYLCASLEIVLFALLWAVQGNNAFGRLIFTVLKIGFLLMVINNFETWLNQLLSSFTQIAHLGSASAIDLVNAPGTLWQYGYDNAIIILKAATVDGISMGLSLLLTILGLGILLVFGWLGAKLIITMAAFYLSALIALLFIPLGILKPTADFAYRGLQSVLKSGVGLLALLLILSGGTAIWQDNAMHLADNFNLNQILAIFFTGLVFLLLSQTLPTIAANAIGQIKPWIIDSAFNTSPTIDLTTSNSGANADLRAATTIDPSYNNTNTHGHFSAAVQLSPQTNASSANLGMAKRQDKQDRGRFDSATEVSISKSTLQKLKSTYNQP